MSWIVQSIVTLLDSLCSYVCFFCAFFFLMRLRPPRSTLDRSSAASDVYKRQDELRARGHEERGARAETQRDQADEGSRPLLGHGPVSYTHLRAHETVLDLVCRLLLEKKKSHAVTETNYHANEQETIQCYHNLNVNKYQPQHTIEQT